jgi:hypothetical protein
VTCLYLIDCWVADACQERVESTLSKDFKAANERRSLVQGLKTYRVASALFIYLTSSELG